MKKKCNVILMLAVLAICLTGCSSQAKSQVKNFCDAVKSLDYSKMEKCFEEDMFTEEDITDIYYDFEGLAIDDIFQAHAKNIQYKLGTLEKDEDDDDYAYMDVTLSYDDYSEALITAMDMYEAEADDETEEMDRTRIVELLREQVANNGGARVEEVVTFYCEKAEGKWVLSYDYEMFERFANAITCNMLDAYNENGYYFDFDDDTDDEVVSNNENDQDTNNTEDTNSDNTLSEKGENESNEPQLAEFNPADLDNMSEEQLLNYLLDYMDNIEGGEMTLVKSGYTVDYDEDEESYIIVGDMYDFDIYSVWRKIVGTDGEFARRYPDTYQLLDDGLWGEEVEIYIPKNAKVGGIWPESESGSYSAISDLEQLLKSGHEFVYSEESDISEIYDSYTNYANYTRERN